MGPPAWGGSGGGGDAGPARGGTARRRRGRVGGSGRWRGRAAGQLGVAGDASRAPELDSAWGGVPARWHDIDCSGKTERQRGGAALVVWPDGDDGAEAATSEGGVDREGEASKG
jgi:hypothetical protein